MAACGFLLIAIGAVFAGFGGVLVYIRDEPGRRPDDVAAGDGWRARRVLLVGDLLNQSQRR